MKNFNEFIELWDGGEQAFLFSTLKNYLWIRGQYEEYLNG